MLVPSYPPCSCVFLSRLKLRIIHPQRGGVIFHPKRERTKTIKRSPKTKKFNKLLLIINTMARKPYPVHNIIGYQCTYKFQRTGRQVH